MTVSLYVCILVSTGVMLYDVMCLLAKKLLQLALSLSKIYLTGVTLFVVDCRNAAHYVMTEDIGDLYYCTAPRGGNDI